MAAEDARDAERGERDRPAPLAPAPAADAARSRGLSRLRGRRGGRAGTAPDSGTESAPEHVSGEAVAAGQGDESGHKSGRVRAFAGALADRVMHTAPRIPVRDLETLRRQFPGLGPEEIADKLIAGASHGSATVGAGIGAAAMMPVPPALPAELATEIVGVALVEVKLIAELHEVYGRRPSGNIQQRATAYLSAWTSERDIDLARPMTLNAALGGQMKRELRQQIMKRMFRTLPNLTPFMVGAAVGAVMNRRETKKVADKIRKGLRERAVPWEALPPGPGAASGTESSGTEPGAAESGPAEPGR